MTQLLLIALGSTMIFVAATSRVEGHIKALAVQGALLFFIVLTRAGELELATLIFLSIETLGVKVFAVPILLMSTVRRNEISRDSSPDTPSFWATGISSAILLCALGVGLLVGGNIPAYFGASFAIILTALVFIMTRKKIISHILGYMMLENGVFLLSTIIATEMPLIADMGVVLDVFVGVYVLAVFFNKVQSLHVTGDIDELSSLKD